MGKGHFNNNGGRGRSYGLLLLVAFGFAILGVMVLHKLRERRIINLVVKQKDHQLFSLQLLLQKEREYVKEAKSKMESMKAKMRSLRDQKMELDSRLLEMQSTISSLRDDQMAIEIALDEKRKELNQQRERSQDSKDQTIQAKALSLILRQKEAEIEELKHYHQLPLKALSLRTDDSLVNQTSNATQNLEVHKSGELKSENVSVLADDGRSNEEVIENGAILEKVESRRKNESGSEDDDYHGPKVEMPKNLHGRGYTFRGQHGRISRLKGKRWRSTAKGKENSINSTMNTLTTNEGLKMKISKQEESEKGKSATKLPENKAEEIMTKVGNNEERQNVTHISIENSNSSYEQSSRDIVHDHRDRGTYNKSSNQSEDQVTKKGNRMIDLNKKDEKPEDPKMKDVHEAETERDTHKQSQIDSEEKGEDEQE